MKIQNESIVYPLPSEELLYEKERKWRLTLPVEYKAFILENNGCIPEGNSFEVNGHSYTVTRFLCILKDTKNNNNGWYDISVVESQIGERLTDNEDLIGVEVLPIAELFAGDYVCLDFRSDMEKPEVCIWDHEESGDFSPVTIKVSESFSEFLNMLS